LADRWEAALRARGSTPVSELPGMLPDADWFQARLVLPGDEAELRADSLADNASGRAYRRIRERLALARASAEAVEGLLKAAWLSEPGALALPAGPLAPMRSSEYWLPELAGLNLAHRYALDLFFTVTRREGGQETGPAIRSISRGVVVAAATDWSGGEGLPNYLGGGLSPKAGNGAIVYCPDDGRYYAYFHLADVAVAAGNVVAAGTMLGHGGNSGGNARRAGHGAHVHIEIHEPDGSAWTATRLRALVRSLR
jgi:murein DD-endopeptidase MepM/ murein hydrolase activator NlpD